MWRGLLALFLAAILAGCGKPPLYQQESYVFGTRVEISIYGLDEKVAASHVAVALSELDRLNRKLHAWQPSDLTRLNQAFAKGEAAPADIELQQMLQQANRYAQLSDQLFNPAIGHLIEMWGFHNDTFAAKLPAAAAVASAVAANPQVSQLSYDNGQVSSSNPAVMLDFGGFAKGWALDLVADYFRRSHVDNALINIGGNVLALGKKGNEAWKVGLQSPRAQEAMATLELRDGEAIGTSGDYQRYFELAGKRYSHLIDPRSGQPAQGVESVTVLVEPSKEAGTISDVATKPMFIGGRATTLMYASRFGIQDVLLIDATGNAFVTPSLQQRLHWLKAPPHIYRLR